MAKANLYDTVVLTESIGGFCLGDKGAVVEFYTTPYEAYDIEIVTDEGKTRGLLEAVGPDQFQVFAVPPSDIRITSVRVEAEGTCAAVSFSDGTKVTARAEDLYARRG